MARRAGLAAALLAALLAGCAAATGGTATPADPAPGDHHGSGNPGGDREHTRDHAATDRDPNAGSRRHPLAERHRVEDSGVPGGPVTVVGRLTFDPQRKCTLLRAPGRTYQLVGPYPGTFVSGRPVQVVGTLTGVPAAPGCGTAVPLRVVQVRRAP